MKCNILVTSRPHNIVDVEEYFDVVVEVQGFNQNQTEQFISKIVKDKGKQKSTLKFHDENFIRGREKYAKPMLLLFVCILVNSDEINLESKHISLEEVYTRLVRLLYRKYVVRTGKKFSVTQLVHLLKKVGKIVWETLQQKSSNDTEYNFLHKCQLMNEVGDEAFECGFLVGHEDFRMTILSDIGVNFPHRSIQEFFGAFYYSLVLGTGDEESISSGRLLLFQDHIFFHFCVWLTSAENKLLDFPNRPEVLSLMCSITYCLIS